MPCRDFDPTTMTIPLPMTTAIRGPMSRPCAGTASRGPTSRSSADAAQRGSRGCTTERVGARRRSARLGAPLAFVALVAGLPVQAQTDSPLPIDSAAADQNTRQRPLWELGAGIAGLRLPDYRGSDQAHGYLLPLPFVVYRGRFLRADRDGARAVLLDRERLQVDVSVAGSVPTRSNGNAARRGMPDLPGTFEIGPNVDVTLAGSVEDKLKLDLRLPLRGAFTAQRSPKWVGITFSPNLNLDIGGVAGGWNVGLLGGPLYANRKHHAHYYGVDGPYATADRPAYRAAGGYAGWQALVATSRRFENVWLGAFLRYDSLRGAVFETSPLVKRTSAVTVGFGVSYIFARSSTMVATPD